MILENTEKYFFKAFGLVIQSPISVRGLIPAGATEKPDITVLFEKIDAYPELKLTKVKRKGLTATFGMFEGNTNDAYMVWENLINFRLINGHTMTIETDETDLDFLSLFIVSEPLGILLFQRGDILLHASAVKLPNGDGIVFMGEPGAGKSTTAGAFVKAGCKIISDDLVAIRLIDNKPYLVPSFPQIKLWKKSVEGLGYGYDEVEKIVEGTNKFAYFEKKFDTSPVLLGKMLIFEANKIKPPNGIHYSIELLKHFALPEQLLEKGENLKYHFEKNAVIAINVDIVHQKAFNSFDDLNDFVKKTIET